MCIILIGKIGKKLHETAKSQNPDGFSLFTQEQGLIKSPTDEQVKQAVGQFGIWHYRIRSSGAVDQNNIHPFPVAKGKWYLYHNGVLGEGTVQMSDTACLAKTLYDAPVGTVDSVLKSLSNGQRFCLADAKNPLNFRLYGDWKVEKGILMSHKMYYSNYYYSKLSTAQKAGWSRSDDDGFFDLDDDKPLSYISPNYYGKGVGPYNGGKR